MIDYDRLAADYARHRTIHPEVFCSLIATAPVTARSQVLEIGCGTGSYIAAMQSQTGAACWGIDPSAQMLSHAQARAATVHFQQSSIQQADLPAASFDLIFSVDVIHHVTDQAAYFRQAIRFLKAGGRLCTVTDSEAIIRQRQPLATYFPETVEADLARYPRIEELQRLMAAAGFTDVTLEQVEFAYPLASIQSFRDRAFSVLHLISDAAFQRGLARLEADFAAGRISCMSRYALLWGSK